MAYFVEAPLAVITKALIGDIYHVKKCSYFSCSLKTTTKKPGFAFVTPCLVVDGLKSSEDNTTIMCFTRKTMLEYIIS